MKRLTDEFETRIFIEENYCPATDTTFLIKETCVNGELKYREVVGFYSGEPNAKDTAFYKDHRLKAIYS